MVSEATLLALLCWFLVSALITAGWILAAEVSRKVAAVLGKKRIAPPEQVPIEFTYRK